MGFAWLILRKRLTWPLLGCAALAIVGVVVAGIDVSAGADTSLADNLLIVAGVGCSALYTILARRSVANTSPLLLVTFQQTAALFCALLIWPAELWRLFDSNNDPRQPKQPLRQLRRFP
jgi:drug/metabolite transporter (DMT)-like permease